MFYVKHKRSYLLFILLISSFGPYISGGVRLEHLFIYPAAVYSLIATLVMRKRFFQKELLLTTLFLFAAALWPVLITQYSQLQTSFEYISALENFTQPVALLIVCIFVFSNSSLEKTKYSLRFICLITIFLFSINALLGIFSIYSSIPWIEEHFIRGETESGLSVWQNAASMGRYSGIFNQPIEAGIGYTISLLCWVYLMREGKSMGSMMSITLILIITGGLLTGSKVFLFGGLSLSVLYSLRDFIRSIFSWRALIIAITFALVAPNLIERFVEDWKGLNMITRFFESDNYESRGTLTFITAGRIGSTDSFIWQRVEEVQKEAPLTGLGYIAPSGPLDNGFIEYYFRGGPFSLFFYVMAHIMLMIPLLRTWDQENNSRLLLLLLLIVSIGAGIGGPTFTANRTSVFLIIILANLVFISSKLRIDNRRVIGAELNQKLRQGIENNLQRQIK